MRTFGVQEGEAITHKWLNKAIATAQKRVEQRNYEIRKNLLKYDDVVNDQRKAVFEQRQEFMISSDLSEIVAEMRANAIEEMVQRTFPPKAYADQWDVDGLTHEVKEVLGLDLPIAAWAAEEGIGGEEIRAQSTRPPRRGPPNARRCSRSDQMRQVEKNILLQMIDLQWREHLMHLDHLKNGIGLRGYGQRDPLNEYKTEAFSLFEKLIGELRSSVTRWLMTVEFRFQDPPAAAADRTGVRAGPRWAPTPAPRSFTEIHLDPITGVENELALLSLAGDLGALAAADCRDRLPSGLPEGWQRTGRNATCPCGSGKKSRALPRGLGLTPPKNSAHPGARPKVCTHRVCR